MSELKSLMELEEGKIYKRDDNLYKIKDRVLLKTFRFGEKQWKEWKGWENFNNGFDPNEKCFKEVDDE